MATARRKPRVTAHRTTTAASGAGHKPAPKGHKARVAHHRTPKVTKGKTKAGSAKKRGAQGMIVPGYWVTGANDEAPTCISTAIANSLLAVTGIRVTDADVLELDGLVRNSSPDGVSIEDVLDGLKCYGIGGHYPSECKPWPWDNSWTVNGLVVGMTDGVDDHAVTWTPQGLISWGAPLIPDLANGWLEDGEVWHINWRGEGK